jgi:hypothetical protein
MKNNSLINKILAYPAKEIKAKPPAPYSTLKPETNSDSPSAKSNGVRLVSAKQEINHTKDKIYIYIGSTQKVEHSWGKVGRLYCKCYQETENGDEFHRNKKEGTHTKNKRGGRAKQQASNGLEVSGCLKTVGYLED